jgi:hypothetical protein
VVRFLVGVFLIARGLVHLAIWLPKPSGDAPFAVNRSAIFGDVRRIAMPLAVGSGVIFALAGVGVLLGGQDWGAAAAIAGALVSIALMALTFTPWWAAGLVINATIIALAWRALSNQG